MPNIVGPITWSQHDEQCLRNLTARKAEFTKRARDPLHDFLTDNFGWPANFTQTQRVGCTMNLVDWLIEHADTIRDLLQPFDSGVRAAQPSTDRVHPDQ